MVQEGKELRILMLEDNLDDVDFIERILRKNKLRYVSRHCDTRDEFINEMRTFKPDVVLSDHGLPQFNSREALKICVREDASTPFIIVTGTMTDEFAIACLQEGADDYLLKSNLSRLPSAIRRALKERRLERLKREARHALRKQNKELIKVNTELDKFVYSVSHNIRGPLASVLGLVTIAKIEDTDQKLSMVLGMMDTSLHRLDETLKEILDFLRNERSEISVEDIHWDELLAKCTSKLKFLERFKDVTLDYHVHASSPFRSDPHRITAALTNVLCNAIMFSDPQKKAIATVRISVNDEGAEISIADNGFGIKDEYLPKVSTMFFRASELSQGAGLGLYITKEVLRKLNGTITILSTEGAGTSVTIRIPKAGEVGVGPAHGIALTPNK